MWLLPHSIATLTVRTERNGWDWLLYGLSILAALGAVVALWTWWTNLRRVPEVGFRWDKPDGSAWAPEDPLNLRFAVTLLSFKSSWTTSDLPQPRSSSRTSWFPTSWTSDLVTETASPGSLTGAQTSLSTVHQLMKCDSL